MGCTSSNTADKDDAPYGKSISSPGPKPSNTTPVPNTVQEHATTTTTTTGSQQNTAAAPPTSSDKKKKTSGDSPDKDSKKSSKPKTHNKQKEWGDKGERRAQQNQVTKTEMEPFITAPEYKLKRFIEKNKERNKEVVENLDGGVSHVGTDGMVYLSTKEEATKGGGKKQQSGYKGNKATHMSDIKMPPPPSVPYTYNHPTDTHSNDQMEHFSGNNPRHEEVRCIHLQIISNSMVTFQGDSVPKQSINSPSSQQRTSNEPSVQFADIVLQHTIISSGLEFIAAIDLGYAYSGYAFMDIRKPYEVEVNRNWASHLGYTSYKAPTAILFNSKDVVQAFGYQAYEIYDQLISKDKGNLLLYKLAHSFKQKPQDKLTWKLIATLMQYLKTECENMISKRYNIEPQKVSVNWTIPFPTDWDSRDTMSTFKDHMHKAGFRKSSISWFPDVECSLHYCINLNLKDGKQCILISAGETAVLTYVYQYSKTNGWSSVNKAKSMGGKDIGRLFTKFLGYIFGDNFISEFQRLHPSEWCILINAFDLAKRDIATGMQLSVNYAFENFYRKFTGGKTLKYAINKKSKETGPSVSLTKSGTLKFRHRTMIMLFNAVLQDIEGKVKSAVTKFPKADTMFLVGGLADCEWVRERIASGANGRRLVIPEEPNLCVLKGAVLKEFAKRENDK